MSERVDAAQQTLDKTVAAVAEHELARLAAAGLWSGDPKRAATSVGRYAASIFERGKVREAK